MTNRRNWLKSVSGGLVLGTTSLTGLPLAFAQVTSSRRPVPSVDQIRSKGEEVWKLVDLINAYRRKHRLEAITLSPRLTAVAAWHVKDLAEQQPHKTHGSLHSWSESRRWKGGPFHVGDADTHPVMWDKPREIADYPAPGFEIAASGIRSLAHALQVWQGSAPHNDVILNRNIWRDHRWQALGAVYHRGYACAWFGEEKDD